MDHRIEMTENVGGTVSETTALDEYLYKLYESELKFEIEDSFVKRIQTSVENLVEILVRKTIESQIYKKNGTKLLMCRQEAGLLEASLKFLNGDSSDIKENILPVGSFYEDTRNTFPDEFDYVIVLTECSECVWKCEGDKWFYECSKNMLNGFHEALRHVVKTDTSGLKHGDLVLLKVVRTSGPATKLEFVYKHGQKDERNVHVDMSPAIRLKIQKDILNNVLARGLRANGQWYQRVLKTGHYLKMLIYERDGSLSFIENSITETELNFIREEVSFNHKLVYRVLKYILSAQNEEMRDIALAYKMRRRQVYDFPSYLVKTLLYRHLEKCGTQNAVGHCLIDIRSFLLNTLQASLKNRSRKGYFLSPQIETVIGSDLRITDDKHLIKSYEKVLKSFILSMRDIQACFYNENHILVLEPFAEVMEPIVISRFKEEKRQIYIALPMIILVLVTFVILVLYERGIL